MLESNISHDEFVLINSLLKQYDNMNKEKKTVRLNQVYQRF